ncbi:MAG: DNA recombination/repair protein RecA [Bryobacteraceae bacterium]|nr:DNA recombination/repair protein RecA [Bryobacteraceae bacterium]MDW8379618.1 ATPase domain-containing protein [Bryobacterales bacterium]
MPLPGAPAVISTGFVALDRLLGEGIPRCHLIEVFGPPDCAKTTLALHWIAAAQKQSCSAVYIDAEHKFDASWAARCGVCLDGLVLARPDHGGQALAIAEALLRSFSVDLLVIDTIAALSPPGTLIFGSETEASPELDPHEELVSRMLRKLRHLAGRGGVALVAVNQLRCRPQPGTPETSSAGRILGLHSSIRLHLRRESSRIWISSTKNKFAEPYEQVAMRLEGARLIPDESLHLPASGWRPPRLGSSPYAGSQAAENEGEQPVAS